MKTYTLPKDTPMIKLAWNGWEFVPQGLTSVTVSPPFVFNGTMAANNVTQTSVQYDVDYLITTDPDNYLTDANGHVYEKLVGGRPKDRG